LQEGRENANIDAGLGFIWRISAGMGLPMTSDQPVGVRAGFWRRSLALLIDGIIISLPFQVVVAILFAATSGRIQQVGGLTYTNCSIRQTVPDGLAPPPAGSNFARECNVYFFGAQTARTLEVGRVTKEGVVTKTVSRHYMLDRHGRPIDGVSADWIVIMAFIAYLLATEARTGATLGDRAMRIRVVDAAVPAAPSVPLRKIVTRYLVASVGFLPMLAVALALAYQYGADFEEIAASNIFTWLGITAAAAFGWVIFLTVQIIRKRDPLYDRIAGTAVLRVAMRSGEWIGKTFNDVLEEWRKRGSAL
jgi:uncharacterized RDD family membrane protein YckC